MIPNNHPAYAGNWVFVSLYSNYLYLYKSLMENTSYFPDINIYKNNIIYQEIQPPNLTVALAVKRPIIPLKNVSPNNLWETVRTHLVSPNTTVIWGY